MGMGYYKEWRMEGTIIISIVVWVMLFLRGNCSYEADRILRLPGQPTVTFQHFSGYITIDEYQNRSLFYYFVEAHTDPASKPLVLWLNGGPGCSSLGDGAFIEHGPFKPKGDVLVRNDFSWNNVANILYLESPAGVGFSFSENTTFYTTVNDKITAQDNLVFLQRWFDKFPEYRYRDFYITGESYSGHYVPQLARLIVESKVNIKLKAIAIGNPVLEFNTDFNSRGKYLWSHGLISDSTYQLLNSVCSISQIIRESILSNLSAACSQIDNLLSREISKSINVYAVNLEVCVSPSPSGSQSQSQAGLLHSLTSSDQKPHPTTLPQYSGDSGKVDVCIEKELDGYLNRADVQKALHAQLVGVANWTFCSNVLKYDLRDAFIPTIYTVASLVRSGIRVLVYSGDQDAVVPFLGTRTLVDKLANNLRLNTTRPYSPWFYKQQVGGWVQAYGDKNILSFATVRGAGHETPYTSPATSLALFTAFLAGRNP